MPTLFPRMNKSVTQSLFTWPLWPTRYIGSAIANGVRLILEFCALSVGYIPNSSFLWYNPDKRAVGCVEGHSRKCCN